MGRFNTPFGNVNDTFTRLRSYVAYYRFDDKTWSIRVWAHNWNEAQSYCQAHGLKLTGCLMDEIE